MTKPLRTIATNKSGYKPKPEKEKEFVAKHPVEVFPDQNGNGDDVFKASKVARAPYKGINDVDETQDDEKFKWSRMEETENEGDDLNEGKNYHTSATFKGTNAHTKFVKEELENRVSVFKKKGNSNWEHDSDHGTHLGAIKRHIQLTQGGFKTEVHNTSIVENPHTFRDKPAEFLEKKIGSFFKK